MIAAQTQISRPGHPIWIVEGERRFHPVYGAPPKLAMPFMPGFRHAQVDAGAAPFEGGNQSHGSILEFARYIADAGDTENVAPTAGGTLTINSQSLGSYDYTIKVGNQTISSFVNSDWFTTTADSRSAIVVIKGDLVMNAGQTLIPSNRKLFVTVYVTGNLVVNGGISMSARGANHSASGSNITAQAIRIATGTFSSVGNPQVPAAGANGGAQRTHSGTSDSSQTGNNGSTGVDGATGGGGGGGLRKAGATNFACNSGAGVQGTGFGGGPGGGGVHRSSATGTNGENGAASGGKGGDGGTNTAGGNTAAGGGAGNPGGTEAESGTSSADPGGDGTGGILFVIVEGNHSGSGDVTAAGSGGGGTGAGGGGGGSGGGSVTMMIGGTDSGPTPTALGGAGGSSSNSGGAGGNGTARKLALA